MQIVNKKIPLFFLSAEMLPFFIMTDKYAFSLSVYVKTVSNEWTFCN